MKKKKSFVNLLDNVNKQTNKQKTEKTYVNWNEKINKLNVIRENMINIKF